ncbi:DMT family transporter [Natronobiforma cellulositropha]|uniref:DMT family transporter n=1 Tax=Natronobiforma cellulositropha TaxID=1679076 RepID=UPI0021D5DE6C|nr:EamA family transporter [Natronobiforma cellulositropha]
MVDSRQVWLFALASLFFGGTFVAANAGQAYIPPLLFVALRFDVAALLLAGYVLLTVPRGERLPRTRGDLAGILAAGLLAIGAANALLFVGQGYVTSAVGAIVFSLVPILSPLFATAVLADERLTVAGALGGFVSLVGVALVIGIDPGDLAGAVDPWALVVLAGAVSAALGAVLIRRVETTTSSTVRTAWALPISAIALHGASLAAGESPAAIEWTLEAVLALGYLSVLAGAVAYIAYFELLEEVGAIRSSLTFYVSPVVASLGGWALLGETLSALALVGFATIVLGFAVMGHRTLQSAVAGHLGRSSDEERRPAVTTSETVRTRSGNRYVTSFDLDGD